MGTTRLTGPLKVLWKVIWSSWIKVDWGTLEVQRSSSRVQIEFKQSWLRLQIHFYCLLNQNLNSNKGPPESKYIWQLLVQRVTRSYLEIPTNGSLIYNLNSINVKRVRNFKIVFPFFVLSLKTFGHWTRFKFNRYQWTSTKFNKLERQKTMGVQQSSLAVQCFLFLLISVGLPTGTSQFLPLSI